GVGYRRGSIGTRLAGLEHVSLPANSNARRDTGLLEQVMSDLQVLPERGPLLLRPGLQRFLRHAKRKDLHLKTLLAILQCGSHDPPDFVNYVVGHGVTAHG